MKTKLMCIERIRDKSGKVVEYVLEDILTEDKTRVKPEELKSAIRCNKVDIINLTLTSNGRLIDNGGLEKFNKKLEKLNENGKVNKDDTTKAVNESKKFMKRLIKDTHYGTTSFLFKKLGYIRDIKLVEDTIRDGSKEVTNLKGYKPETGKAYWGNRPVLIGAFDISSLNTLVISVITESDEKLLYQKKIQFNKDVKHSEFLEYELSKAASELKNKITFR